MKLFSSPLQMMRWRRNINSDLSIGFIPTMGALHDGHMSLIRRAKKENDITGVSIFVNPLQFGANEDFDRYPRTLKSDRQKLSREGINFLFAPRTSLLVNEDASTKVVVSALNQVLCGQEHFRGEEHFNGVSTIVSKLFNLIRPTCAYFGMKDFQQLRVLEQMNKDLNFGVHIVRCKTIRESDGLAMSSRNAYLSPEERAWAPRLWFSLQHGRKLLTSSPSINPKTLTKKVRLILSSIPHVKVDYVELVDAATLNSLSSPSRDRLLAAAIHIGKTRLIDNILIPAHA